MTRDGWMRQVPTEADRLDGWLTAGRSLWPSLQEMGNAIKDASRAACQDNLAHAERLAHGLIRLGEVEQVAGLIALGEIALGDAWRLQGRHREGCALLDSAAERFRFLDDRLGWARTRIGWLGSAHHLPELPILDEVVREAAAIFSDHACWDWLSTLYLNYAYYHLLLGHLNEGLPWCLAAREAAERIEDEEERFLPISACMLRLIGFYNDLGRYEKAQRQVEETLVRFRGREVFIYRYVEVLARAGRFYLDTGRYSQSLFYYYEAQRLAPTLHLQNICDMSVGVAYLRLNRLNESVTLLRGVLERVQGHTDQVRVEEEARVYLAQVYGAQERWADAHDVLGPAIASLEAAPKPRLFWASEAYRQWMLCLSHLGKQGELPSVVARALELVEALKEPPVVASTYLVAAEVVLDDEQEAEQALTRAREFCNEIPWLRWRIHTLTARRARSPQEQRHALEQAADDLDLVQSSLAASFHADFLAEAQAVYDRLIAAHLEAGEIPLAWQTLERAKSRALLNTLMYHQEAAAPPSSRFLDELKRLQLRHYELVKGQMDGRATREEVQAVERELARVQEAIEVERVGGQEPPSVPPLYLPVAPPDSDLVGYYLVRDEVHAFIHNGTEYHHLLLPTTAQELHERLTAISVNVRTVPHAPEAWLSPLTQQLHRLLAQLDGCLLAPLRPFLRHDKLVVVPHGLLHQMPFHLLRHEERYLLEQCEVRLVPTARLAERPPAIPHSSLRHAVVSHSWGGKLPHTRAEGEMVADALGNAEVFDGEMARKESLYSVLGRSGVLHIAAHGEHRPDHPELSHIQLEDGPFSLIDLLQHTLHHSLVTLSACDTGQVVIRAGDDPVGLWRGFLAAGARSLLVALWQLEDQSALQLMQRFYEALARGVPKMAALRSVQQAWLRTAEGRFRHPFYWGAFQLIGDDGPLQAAPDPQADQALTQVAL